MSIAIREIQALLEEPACTHHTKEKSGCAKPKPGTTVGGCSFDGAQITLWCRGVTAHRSEIDVFMSCDKAGDRYLLVRCHLFGCQTLRNVST